jgi:hypothetical protein
MTLGIGYQGRDFAALLTDSRSITPARTPVFDGEKFMWSRDRRLVSVISGAIPTTSCDVTGLTPLGAAREYRDWLYSGPQFVDASDGRGYECLVAGSTKGITPTLVCAERGHPLRVANPGDVFVIGSGAPLARKLDLEAGASPLLNLEAAGDLLLGFAGKIMEAVYDSFGCSSAADFAAKKPGWVLTIAPPFHIAAISSTKTIEGSYSVQEMSHS